MSKEYNNKMPWNTPEDFYAASDERIEIWRKQVEEIDRANEVIHNERIQLYETLKNGIKELYGGLSVQYKYICKREQKDVCRYTKRMSIFTERMRYREEKRIQKAKDDMQKQREREAIERRKEATFAAWEIAKRHNISVDATTDVESVFEALIGKDKYLGLADAMSKTRGDWSEGFWRVEEALRSFAMARTEVVDDLIITDIRECLNSDCEDGRIFRDTEWNYDRLYEMVDAALLADYRELSSFVY